TPLILDDPQKMHAVEMLRISQQDAPIELLGFRQHAGAVKGDTLVEYGVVLGGIFGVASLARVGLCHHVSNFAESAPPRIGSHGLTITRTLRRAETQPQIP